MSLAAADLGAVLDALPEGVQVVDPAFRYVYVNETAARHGRTTPAELLGRTMMERYPGIDATPMFALIRSALEQGASHVLANDFTFPEGSVGHFELRIRPVPGGVCILSFDVTTQTSAERARRADKERVEAALQVVTALAEHAPVPMWAMRAESDRPEDLRTLVGNPAAFRFAPYMDGAVGKTLGEIDPALAKAPMVPAILRAALGGEAVSIPEIRTSAGAFVQAEVFPIGARRAGVVVQDVSVARRAADALAAANAELEAFGYSVSHDLRAPLRAISGFATALDEDHGAALDGTGRDYLARIRAAAARMAELIDDLLELSRTTRAAVEATDVDVSAMVRSIVAGLRRAPGGDADVVIEPGITAWADPRLLRIGLENLLGNAWKFTRKTAAPRIEIALETGERGRAIVVRDNGAGFDPAYASKLFGVFQRLHTTAEFDGTGIGLATVQRIAQKHGGTVEAEGAPGLGATFRLRLPDRPAGAPKGGAA